MMLFNAEVPRNCGECEAILRLRCSGGYGVDERPKGCSILCKIPDNPTNGDIITALFSQYGDEVFDLRFYEDGEIIINTDSEWWDTPYKGVEK